MIPSQRQPPNEEEWREISAFPGYSVSDTGFIQQDRLGHRLTRLINQRGVTYVGLSRDGKQHNRSVALLVAEAFLIPHQYSAFDTPINLDGDRANNHASNLMWRPRWFAVKYHQQFHNDRRGFHRAVEEIETGEQFKSSWYAAIKFGLLDREIMLATLNGESVWPTGQRFVQIAKTHIIPRQKRGV